MNPERARKGAPGAILVAGLLVSCTVLGLAGIDLVLPAVPMLPEFLGGSISQSQMVLATFAAGSGVGLLLFGELGARIEHRRLLLGGLIAYGVISAAAALSSSLTLLIALRFLQGVAASAAAVVTPGMVRQLFDEQGALRALGALGSIEALAPAIAPVIGVWLLSAYGWTASFWVTAVLALLLAALVAAAGRRVPEVPGNPSPMGYLLLLKNPVFQRYALSQGFSLGSLLVFVFAMPTVFVVALGGAIQDFIIMQILGISSFIVAANLSSRLVQRFGAETMIWSGSLLMFLGALLLLTYGLLGGREPPTIWLLFLPFNIGIGLRGPPGFFRALQASAGDDGRASALVVLWIMLVTAGGTATLAPLVAQGLWPATVAAAALSLVSLIILKSLPSLDERPDLNPT